jgi:glycosyltransferase involved in cell wall biosynthesis
MFSSAQGKRINECSIRAFKMIRESMRKRVFLLHEDTIAHYRIPIYNYLANYLKKSGYTFTVVTEGIQKDNPHAIEHELIKTSFSTKNLTKLLLAKHPDILIFYIGLKRTYLFPLLIVSKILGKKTIHWGHGRDLEDSGAIIKNLGYAAEQLMHDAIILYAEPLRRLLPNNVQHKVFIANNTLVLPPTPIPIEQTLLAKKKYNILKKKNIIFMGRIEKRKRVLDLIDAFRLLNVKDVGLLLVGPDKDGILPDVNDQNIRIIGPIYGDERLALLSACDVFCLPGHVGLSIVDAFWCGLPIVTENVIHAPEVMYLKDGKNGFIVPAGDVRQLAQRLETLLANDELRAAFSQAARAEIKSSGHIDKMCEGFEDALNYVNKKE